MVFLIAINPATYIERFSHLFLKMNVINESNLLLNKLNSFGGQNCTVQSYSPYSVQLLFNYQPLTISLDNGRVDSK